MTTRSTPSVQSLDIVVERLKTLNSIEGMSWRMIASLDEFSGVPAGTLASIAKGREPKDDHIRESLNLPILRPAPVCRKCGQVHVTKRCVITQPRKRAVPHEHLEQVALMQRCAYHENEYPELRWLFAVPNGGARNKVVGAKMKAEGVKRGVPDLFLPAPRFPYHGLFIEMKAEGGRVSPEQAEWISHLGGAMYKVVVAWSYENAWDELIQYLSEGRE